MHVMITHIIGTNNCIADAISRFQMDRFRSLAPHANPHADPILALPTPSSANCETAVSTWESRHPPDECMNRELKPTINFVRSSKSSPYQHLA